MVFCELLLMCYLFVMCLIFIILIFMYKNLIFKDNRLCWGIGMSLYFMFWSRFIEIFNIFIFIVNDEVYNYKKLIY